MSWITLDNDRKKEIITQVSNENEISPNAIEKDWWVTTVLRALFQSKCATALIFKGGTSLSKGWGIIKRFSEDIDLAIDREYFDFSELESREFSQQLLELRRRNYHYVQDSLISELKEILHQAGINNIDIEFASSKDSRTDPVVLLVKYESLFPTMEYVQPWVKIEMNCRSLHEPFEEIKMNSLISLAYPKASFVEPSFVVKTVLPTRTFLEKIFLLHEECKKRNIRTERITRHLYDLEKLMDTSFGKDALKDAELYTSIVKHRYDFNNISGLNYRSHHPSSINILPADTEILKAWEKDYDEMQRTFIYGDRLKFGELLERMNELVERVRLLQVNDEFFNDNQNE